MRKSIVGKLFIAMIISHSFLAYFDQNAVVKGELDRNPLIKDRGHYTRGMNPGLMLRLEQKSINGLKYAFQ